MRKTLHLILSIVLCLSTFSVYAQENASRQIYNQAEREYNIGRIDQSIQLLQDNLSGFDGQLKQSAYRLLALCYLSEDRNEEARHYAELLIKLNNYYNSTDDPARFQDLVNQLKAGIVTTITTASSQSETINEAPVPITIITAEMIEELGYNKNLGQILSAYVPGISRVTNLEEGDNLSMHGAYANQQELILIMENGHRLNTRFDNSGPTSYSISTEKIDHIEVLRGPASSLYGNVALSAVVNIITKSGRETNGVRAKYGFGRFNTHKADFMIGTQFMDADIFAWASIYNSDGQVRNIHDGDSYLLQSYFYKPIEAYEDTKILHMGSENIYVDGYKDKPAYDVGLSFKLKGFDLMFSRKNVKKVLQEIMYHGGYSYDHFYPLYDIKPGYSTESSHAEIGYTHQLGKFLLNASLYSDWYSCSYYEAINDSSLFINPKKDEGGGIIYNENGIVELDTIMNKGRFNFSHQNEHTVGGTIKATTDYRLGYMKGNLLIGSQYEHFSLLSVNNFWGNDYGKYTEGNIQSDYITDIGDDGILSFFVQDKHYFLPRLILNAGIRYDLKYRKEEDVVKTFSPRMAIMYVPNERFSLKLSYSQAFADLSFYNRYLTKTDYTTTEPQHLSALQLTAMGNVPTLHLNYEANLFYNKYSNLLCWLGREENFYNNVGRLTNIGFEGTANYAYKRLSAYLSLYYCHDVSSAHYYFNNSKKMVCGVPHFTLNLHTSINLLQEKKHKLKVYGQLSYTGRKLQYQLLEEKDFFVDAKLIFDVGLKYCYKQFFQFNLDCENLFDTYHYICGPNYMYVPQYQKGRTLMASVSFQI